MLYGRWKLILVLAVATVLSYWILEKLTVDESMPIDKSAHYPDQYMENFTTLIMDEYGQPEHRLEAAYMARYPDIDTTELYELELTIFDVDKPPIIINADKGWITSDNNDILLVGNVHLQQHDESGELLMAVITEQARVLIDKKYAETDKPTTLVNRRVTSHTVGVRAYLEERQTELLNNVQTIIRSEKTL